MTDRPSIQIKKILVEYQEYFFQTDKLKLTGNSNLALDNDEEAAAAYDKYCSANSQDDCQRFIKYLDSIGYANIKKTAYYLSASAGARCFLDLANESTMQSSELAIPKGKRTTVLSVDADYKFDVAGNSDNDDRFFESVPKKIYLAPARSAYVRDEEKIPLISGVGYSYGVAEANLGEATHVEIKIFPETKGYLIVEIYDADSESVSVEGSKVANNHWRPNKDVDQFKVRMPYKPTGKWQTFTIPLEKFVDWNRKKQTCNVNLPGLNENIGDGVLNIKKNESYQLQIMLEAEDFGKKASAYVNPLARFLKFE